MKKVFLFCIILPFIHGALFAQDNNIFFSYLTTTNGLSQNPVQQIFQDSTGFLWFGTEDGLNRYDGYNIEQIRAVLGSDQGLTGNDIMAICETSKGKYWIGTSEGLTIYNSRDESYYQLFSLKDNNVDNTDNINCLFNTGQEVLIGTSSGIYLGKEEQDSISIKILSFSGGNEREEFEVYCFIRTSGRTVLACTSIGVLNIDQNNFEYTKEEIIVDGSQYNNLIFNIFRDTKDRLWLVTEDGICLSDGSLISNIYTGEGVIETKTISEINNRWEQLNKVTINDIIEISDGNYWISTLGHGIISYNIYFNSVTEIRFSEKDGALSNDFVHCMKIDNSGIIWIGTDAGLSYFDPLKTRFSYIKSDPFQENGADFRHIHAIYKEDNGNLWIGTKASGLFLINQKKKKTLNFTDDNILGSSQVRTIMEDKDGLFWIGTGNGIRILKSIQGEIVSININSIIKEGKHFISDLIVYSLAEDKDGNIWIGTGNGLYFFDRLNNCIHNFSDSNIGQTFKSKTIYALSIDSRDRLWVGTINGPSGVIFNYEQSDITISSTEPKDSYVFKPFEISPGLGSQFKRYSCFAILETSNNQIWFGTNYGLFPLDIENFELAMLDRGDLIPTGMIYGLEEDKNGHIWISTSRGLHRYNPVQSSIISFSPNDGLQSMEFNGGARFKDNTGNIYFGGAMGLNIFNPQEIIHQNNYDPPISILKLYVNGSEVKINDGSNVLKESLLFTNRIKIKKIQNSIGIEFASLHLGSSTHNQYEYMMSKVVGSWVNIKNQNSITFTNLSQGTYTLKIRGTNNDGRWGTNVASIDIRIKPAWYESPVAIITYALLLFLFILFLRRNTIKRVELEQAIEMEKLEKSKSIELNEAKIKFFTNISHEFRTPLTLILAPIKNLHEKFGSDSGISDYLGIIDKNAKRLYRLVNQVLDFRKVSNDTLTIHPKEKNICESVNTVVSHFDLIVDQRNIDLAINCPKEDIQVFYDEDKLEKTLFNLISNSLSAVKDNGKIEIVIRKELAATEINFENYLLVGELNEFLLNNGYAEISITDDGSGLPPESQEKIFEKFYQGESVSTGAGIGLYLVKIFTLHHKGIILLMSESGKGTTFKIRYPLGDTHFTKEQLKAGASESSYKLFDSYETEMESDSADTEISDYKGDTYNLLIVEDDKQMGQYLASELREYDVVHTINAESASDSVNENLPDLIISDILLPGMDGLEFCTKIKETLLTSHIPVILLSARAMDTQILEGLETGADSYLTKPFNIDILKATIKNLIQSKEKLRSGILHVSGFDFKDTNISSVDEVFLIKLKTLIEDNLDNSEYNVEMLSLDMGMSRTHLFRKMKSLTGQTYITFIKTLRLQKAARLLKSGKLNISEIAFSVGFSDPKYFSKTFKHEFGVSPSDYQAGNL